MRLNLNGQRGSEILHFEVTWVLSLIREQFIHMSEEVKPSVKVRSFSVIASIINTLWKIIAVGIIFIAIILASARLFSSEFSRFKPEVEAYLSTQLQRPVTIKSLTLEWPAKGPRILLKNLKVAVDDKQTLNSLMIANGDVAFNLWESIFYLDWITEGVNFQGIQAIINPEIEDPQDKTLAEDDENTEATLQASALNQWLLRQRTIEIYDSYLLIVSKQQQKLSYALPVLTYHGGENKRQLTAHAITSGGSELEIKSEVIGNKEDPQRIIDLYISGQQINLEEFPASILGGNLAQYSGSVDVEVWSQWKGKLLDNIVAKIKADEVSNISSKDKFSLLPFELVFQRSNNDAWAFATSELIIKANQQKLQPFVLKGRNEILPFSGDEKWNFTGLNIPVSMVASLSKSYLPDAIQKWLSQSKPKGKIDNLNASIIFPKETSKEIATQFEVAFDLNKFSSNQWDEFPGVTNLTASIMLNQNGLQAEIDSTLGELDLTPTFRYPLHFNQLTGSIKLSNHLNGSTLLWNDFFFNSEEIQVKSTGKIENSNEGDGYLEIVALLENADTSLTPWFLPVSVMSSNLVNYLDESIHEGKLTRATAIARGPFSAFPYDNVEGVFDIRANIEDVNFRFQRDWGAIDGLSAELRFFGDSMFIDANKGTLSGVKIKHATAEIKQLSDPNASLMIQAEAISQDQAAMDLLTNSPLKNVADSLDILEFGGQLKTSLNMNIPMNGKALPIIDGKVRFNKSSILLKTPQVPFEQIKGYLNFSEKGLTTSKIKGKLWQKDFSFDIKGKTSKSTTEFTGIFNSELSNLGISSLSGINSELFVNGTTPLQGKLGLVTDTEENQSTMTLDFSSDLKGFTIEVPGIIKKEADVEQPLTVNLKIQDDKIIIAGELNKELQLIAEHSNQQWKGTVTNVTNQQQPIRLPEKQIWNTLINAENLELAKWINLVSDLQTDVTTDSSQQVISPFHIEVNANNFSAVGFQFGQTKVILDQNDSLTATINANDIDAEILYTNNPGEPLSINFKKLHLKPEEENENADQEIEKPQSEQERIQQATLAQLDQIKPSEFPQIKVSCFSCSYAEQDLGKIELETIAAGENLAIKGKWYLEDLFENNFTGVWNQHGTMIAGQLVSNDLDAFSNFWDVASGVKKSSLLTNFALTWQGAPWSFTSSTLNGKISSNLTQGHIEEVSTKGAQLFSFLSLQNLKRRLTLDFNDVFEEGFYYDKISATFIVKDGLAYSDTVKINGTAADIEITGYTDLINSSFNQHMVVTPKLSSSLPVLAGWAISPTTALVALVLDKMLLKPALDVVTRIDYKIIGPWEEPEIIEVGKQQKEFQIEDDVDEEDEVVPEENKVPVND